MTTLSRSPPRMTSASPVRQFLRQHFGGGDPVVRRAHCQGEEQWILNHPEELDVGALGATLSQRFGARLRLVPRPDGRGPRLCVGVPVKRSNAPPRSACSVACVTLGPFWWAQATVLTCVALWFALWGPYGPCYHGDRDADDGLPHLYAPVASTPPSTADTTAVPLAEPGAEAPEPQPPARGLYG